MSVAITDLSKMVDLCPSLEFLGQSLVLLIHSAKALHIYIIILDYEYSRTNICPESSDNLGKKSQSYHLKSPND